jgi:3',5'-cyclic AMP phosphodiesterase CpdA
MTLRLRLPSRLIRYAAVGLLVADAFACFAAPAAPAAAAPAAAAPVTTQAPAGTAKPWFFIVAADPQLSGKDIDEQNWTNGIKHINRLRPDFVVVCGDLTFGGNKSEDRVRSPTLERDNKLAEAYRKITAGLDKGITLYNVAGNHDIGQNPSAKTVELFTKNFGKPWQSFQHKGSLFICLESNLLRDGSAAPDLAAQQFTWLKTALAEAKGKTYAHKIIFMHHPLYNKSADEKDAYENMPTPRRKELLTLFHDGGIRAAFFGHRHKNEYVKDGDMEMITTTNAALGASPKNNPHGVRIVEVYPGRIEQKFYAYETLPEKVELKDK